MQGFREGRGQEWDKDNAQGTARQRSAAALVAAAAVMENTVRMDMEAVWMVILF